MSLVSTRCLRVPVLQLACLLLILLLLPAAGFAAPCGTAPTVSLDKATKYAGPGKSVDFVVTITNNDSGSCDFDLGTSGDSAGITSSFPGGTPFTISGLTSDTTIMRVSVGGGVAEWTNNTTSVSVDVVNVNATTIAYDNSPLAHNSINTESTKHAGKWGTTEGGAQYGNITCSTCHQKNSTNIKRVRTSITASSGSFPGDGDTITFLTAENGSSDFGDDSGGHGTSGRICEVCHSATKYHNYNTANNTGGNAHFNNADCISCHKHSEGFKAGACSACHGGGTSGSVGKNFWPDSSNSNPENDEPARHLAHMNALAQQIYGVTAIQLLDDPSADSKQVDLCGYCHASPGGDGDHSASLPAETAFVPVWNKGAAAAGTFTSVNGSCANIACHNGKNTGTTTYSWDGGGGSTCVMCHNDVTSNGNTTGETHNDHMNASANFGITIGCTDCHNTGTAWPTTKPSTGHLNGVLDVTGNNITYAGSVPTGVSFAGCATNDCHNNGQSGAPANSGYTWASNNLADCTICHAAVPGGSHNDHVATAEGSFASGTWSSNKSTVGAYDFGCGNCHGTGSGNHLNGSVTVTGTGWTGTTCNATYCHSGLDVNNVQIFATTPNWNGGTLSGNCNDCHGNSPESGGHEEHQVGFHYDAVYSGVKNFMPVTNADTIETGLVAGPANNGDSDSMNDSRDPLRGHGGKLGTGPYTVTSTTMGCYVCHNDTVTTLANDNNPVCGSCHDDAVAPAMGAATIADKSMHVNGVRDVVFMRDVVRTKAQLRDDVADIPEVDNNWIRIGGYKQPDGSSYDEQPNTLYNMAAAQGGWTTSDVTRYSGLPEEMTQPARTCLISCHLWEAGRVDKVPVHWEDNSIHGPQPIMCIDCHTRLPK